ncbi:hypothetical protein A2W70_00350 [Candidatus Curtissbacteria bacterium RIFCSPLOWO2_02_41_11]|uniref:Type II secretion system protein GspG C-terminal domain-containing protein n=1 Tax=Candidatus Curtissbacteria bacterium RIFCSPLOWO2_02_41_11 TaxID=1797731 RepID=A0A1F5HQ45_9BACT|nr:MAG: hypothetical protein A2W70_00350 [Candidatus Curtissbacteria bacterium RIFCSPLOWO2_02_41_11]
MPRASRTVNNKRETINKNYSFQVSSFKFQVKKGFTLIELLIVISIIGLLAALTLASYGGAQAKARDGIRKSDLAQIRRALELAKSDCTGNAWYPNVTSYSALQTYLKPPNNYMSSVPNDPKNVSPQVYSFIPDPTNVNLSTSPYACPGNTTGTGNYSLYVTLERNTDQDGLASYQKCGGGTSNAKPGLPTSGGDASYTAGQYFVCNS